MDVIETYLREVEEAIREISRDDVRAIVDVLFTMWERGSTAYIIGNGGSASTASHMMNDLSKFTSFPDRPRFRAIALTDNVPIMTAYGNDQSYDDIFYEPMKNLVRKDDVVIAISGSGNSPNVIKAVELAKSVGAVTVGMCGHPGGKLADLADHTVVIPAKYIGQQEDGHLILNHAIATALRARVQAWSGAPS